MLHVVQKAKIETAVSIEIRNGALHHCRGRDDDHVIAASGVVMGRVKTPRRANCG
jgi:hypothetical protein